LAAAINIGTHDSFISHTMIGLFTLRTEAINGKFMVATTASTVLPHTA
jgi:hypothetical protein